MRLNRRGKSRLLVDLQTATGSLGDIGFLDVQTSAMSSFKTAPPGTLDRSRVADQIFKDLRDQIVLGALSRGSKLPAERELAERYGVSGPTVREAIRGLTATGLVDVRHGSGAYVTANTTSLIAMALGTVIQLENLGATDVLSVLGVLNVQAAGLASRNGSKADKARIVEALKLLGEAETSEAAAAAVRGFNNAIAQAASNPLLAALCNFLIDLQTELAMELTGESLAEWRQIFNKLAPLRQQLVDAIVRGDEEAAMTISRDFHGKAVLAITSVPKAREVRLKDPHMGSLLSHMMSRIGSS
jgi:GntR family transcriptional repressor for pyruvate dehydrogenase complex